MFNSKAIKGSADWKVENKTWKHSLLNWWHDCWLAEKLHELKYTIKKPFSYFKKSWDWHWNVFRYDYDFDGHSMFAIIEYKLKRILPQLENGHAVQEDVDMKALKLAIKLAGRLKDDKYDERGYDRHERKWGQLKMWFTPASKTTSEMHTSRPKALTEEQKEQEKNEHWAYLVLSDKITKRDEKWLYSILHKHLRSWWD